MATRDNNISEYRPGVLRREQLKLLVEKDIISGYPEPPEKIGLSSIDLHLGNQIWVMHGGIKGNRDESYGEILKSNKYVDNSNELSDGFDLEPGQTYVVELQEKYKIDKELHLYGLATGKSTIGRLDVLTRLIADHSDFYDELPCPQICKDQNLKGKVINLYVEITPITFKIRIKKGIKLNQLRFFSGSASLSLLSNHHYRYYGALLKGMRNKSVQPEQFDYLSVDITHTNICSNEKASAYKAINNVKYVIDLSAPKGKYNPKDFWKPISFDEDGNTIRIEQNDFYIIRSKERLCLPGDIAVYGQA
ncbi:MAG: 2'-deoxycytidine 5'-triphosphate deaminase, partial [Candidatus Hatepunaea meridiana]|nr:2'-deoxycytidine 5'-triphosphate deaminase [Candidatus Hatepunaea meridiana]